MREMHKWKDKIELSLDNRQIFFLFFGLSVVGCFVFALGVMVGRRVEVGSGGESMAEPGALALLSEEPAPEEDGTALSFKTGLAEPATAGLPPTRDPAMVEAEAEAAAAEAAALEAGVADARARPGLKADKPGKPGKPGEKAAKPANPGDKLAKGMEKPGKPAKPGEKLAAKADGLAQLPKPNAAAGNKPAADAAVLAKGADAVAPLAASPGRFTLQMKAFAKPEEAETFAATLRSNGHDVRIEPHEVKGRIWHRVRMGDFDTWEEGLAAKDSFEAREHLIAYVVRL